MKRIGVEIDRASWNGLYSFPKELASAPRYPDINFAAALLWMGVVPLLQTVPRWWMAIRWAQIKYVYSIDDSLDLRLHPEMADLDKHQKAVLSDEWGMGVALEWLTSTFQYREICHGETAVRELRRRNLLADFREPRKIGPTKCPDFVAQENVGKLHIIECKGTTQGRSVIRHAFETAYQQKHSIQFQNDGAFVAQRLSLGLAIAKNQRARQTTLYVEDPNESRRPPSEGSYVVRHDVEPRQVREAVLASMLIENSALAGAFDVLSAASAAYPDLESKKYLPGRELSTEMIEFEAGDDHWIGQQFQAASPVGLSRVRRGNRITIRNGMSARLRELLMVPNSWRQPQSINAMLDGGLIPLKKVIVNDRELRSSIQLGNAFISEISFTEEVG